MSEAAGDAGERIAIGVSNVNKSYRLYSRRVQSLKEFVLRLGRARWQELRALDHVSFEVPKGQVLGVIGENGSGKSTLLRLLAGIMEPDAGEVMSLGRVSSLLELGAGFHPEYTGRENVYLYGTLLGLRRADIQARFDAILEFSELDKFIEYPVKNYSSGMYMRLGFAVAVHLNPEILLVDEVLAVGDEHFQRKCYAHMNLLRKSGCTIVFVTHDLDAVTRFCDRVIWLDHGRIAADGPADGVIGAYLDATAARDSGQAELATNRRYGAAEIRDVKFFGPDGIQTDRLSSMETAEVAVEFEVTEPLPSAALNITFFREDNVRCADLPSEFDTIYDLQPGRYRARMRLPRVALHRSTYLATIAIYDPATHVIFSIHDRQYTFRVTDPRRGSAVAWLDYSWELEPLQSGVPER